MKPTFDPAHMPCCEDCSSLVRSPGTEHWPPDAFCELGPEEAAEHCSRFARYAESVELAKQVAGAVARIHDPIRRAEIAASFADCMADVYSWFDADVWLSGLTRAAVTV